MKVSVVVPVYNSEPWLARCVDSLLGQTLADIEVVLVDDGSTDASGAIVDATAARDPRVKAIHTENRGPGQAILSGVRAASGEYLAIYDNDDYAPPEALEHFYAKARQYDADLVIGDYWESAAFDSPDFVRVRQAVPEQETSPARALGRWLNREHRGALWALLIRRELYLEQVRTFPLKCHSEDIAALIALLSAARKIVRLDEPVYYYVLRSKSWSHAGLETWSPREKEHDGIMLHWILDRFEQHPHKAEFADALAYFAFLRLSRMQIRRDGSSPAIDLSDIEHRIYRDYFHSTAARRRLRKLWPKQYIFLMAERRAGWRIVKKFLWSTPAMRPFVRTFGKILHR